MSLTIQQQKGLFQLLQTTLDASSNLLNILEQEHQALRNGEPEQISDISTQKLAQLKILEAQLSEQNHSIKRLEAESKGRDFKELLQALPSKSPLVGQWQKLTELADKLQRQNEINGGIVMLSQRHVTTALGVLTGQNANTQTYDPQGKTTPGTSTSHLAKA